MSKKTQFPQDAFWKYITFCKIPHQLSAADRIFANSPPDIWGPLDHRSLSSPQLPFMPFTVNKPICSMFPEPSCFWDFSRPFLPAGWPVFPAQFISLSPLDLCDVHRRKFTAFPSEFLEHSLSGGPEHLFYASIRDYFISPTRCNFHKSKTHLQVFFVGPPLLLPQCWWQRAGHIIDYSDC